MPRYFFNMIDGKFLADDTGTECSGMAEARDQAITTAGSMLRDQSSKFHNCHQWQMHVTDDAKNTVFWLRSSAEDV